ncbi:hypothetical protein EZV62_003207 [Acer yangbiense]|uniref:FAD-binding FR-type domain-containing protein n=1 Tax=Acer yangbiense TaxID=1000413 RepID=A0A5C7IHS2_9ROSI|nr:hypothetical protein EZV62_003207 [Acer yangbiense]
MKNDDVKGADSGNNSDTKESIIGAPVQNNKKSNLDPVIITTGDHNYYDPTSEVAPEIICEDSVSVHNDQTATEGGEEKGEGEEHEDSELESKPSWVGSKLRRASQHIKRIALLAKIPSSRSMTPSKRYDQIKSVAVALKGLKFITTTSGEEGNDWNAVEKRFEKLTASTDGLLHSSMFGECIGMKDENSQEFAGELFRAVARKHKINGDYINKTELKDFWHQISDENFGLKTFFDIVDKDADGKITKDEIEEIISLSASANKLINIQDRAEEYATLIMKVLDLDKVGHIMVNKLETLLLQSPNKYEKVLSNKHKPTHENNPLERCYRKVKYFLINHWQKVWILMLWLGIVSGLFAYKFVQYRNKAAYDVMGYCVCIAKGAAETLKFNMALILLPVCRITITWLRNHTRLRGVVPFDNNLDFHMVIAAGIAVGVIVHVGVHLACDFPRLIHATEEEYEPMKTYFGEEQPRNYWWFVKGVEGVTGIIIVVLMAIAFTLANPWFRRNKLKNIPKPFKRLTGFNAFWYSHHLFVIVYALLIVHGIYLYLVKAWYQKTTWMYLAVPVLLYTCERLIRVFRSSIETVEIIKASVHPDVLALHISKPKGFEYESGQYMFVHCSAVSPFEWHPFSFTSAPGDDYLSVHIRALGDWTNQLNTIFSKMSETSRGGRTTGGFPKIKIDGPYGAPSRDYKTYDVVLLIGLGIGATPMISIVKDIINNIQTKENNSESALEYGDSSSKSVAPSTFRTTKAYYYWVTKDQQSFNWFKEIMAQADEKEVIELHNYCSSVFKEGDARSAIISMLQTLHHAKNGVDVVSDTRVKSHFAKPNWREVYQNIANCHPYSRIGVFYCGPPAVIKELRELALEFSDKTSTLFEFHKENY